MGELKDKAEDLATHVGDYLGTLYKLTIVNVIQKASGVLAAGIISILIVFLLLFALFFLCIGLGWWLGEMLHNMLMGFGIVAMIYLLIIAILLIFRKAFLFPWIRNRIIRKVYE
jgi:hypothetical protein